MTCTERSQLTEVGEDLDAYAKDVDKTRKQAIHRLRKEMKALSAGLDDGAQHCLFLLYIVTVKIVPIALQERSEWLFVVVDDGWISRRVLLDGKLV